MTRYEQKQSWHRASATQDFRPPRSLRRRPSTQPIEIPILYPDYGWYTNRPHGMRETAAPAATDGPPVIVPASRLAPTEASRRWAALHQQIFEVGPLACLCSQGALRLVASITQASVIDQIQSPSGPAPLVRRTPGRGAPHRHGLPRAGARHMPHSRPPRPRPPLDCGPPRRPCPRGNVDMRGGPTAASQRASPRRGYSPGPQVARAARHTGRAPAHRGSRGRGPGPLLTPPQLKFLSRTVLGQLRSSKRLRIADGRKSARDQALLGAVSRRRDLAAPKASNPDNNSV